MRLLFPTPTPTPTAGWPRILLPGRLAILLLAWLPLALPARPADSPPVPVIPPPGPSVFRMPVLVPWPADAAPTAPSGFRVERYAEGLDNPRSLYVLPNGDVLVAQARTERMGGMPPAVVEALTRQGVFGPSANTILLLPGHTGRRHAGPVQAETFLGGLHQPFGMLLLNGFLYVANTDGVVRYPYREGAGRIDASPERVIDIPAGPDNNHWTRNLVATRDGRRILVSVGAATNVNADGRDPPDRAAIWEINPDGSGKRLLATGLRNPVGLSFEPGTGELWTTVNERDGLGEDTPPDYLTRVVDGGFYGWPYVYFGTYPDPVWQKRDPGRVAAARDTARVPDLALGGHCVPLGLLFYRGRAFPERYRHGAFIARRGGGSRVRYLGFDVVFVPFENGRPTGAIEPFLTGFVADADKGTVQGRPVGLAELPDGSLLVSDDAGNIVWRVTHAAGPAAAQPPPATLELRDQFGHTDSLAAHRGEVVVAVVVSMRRLPAIGPWEKDLARRYPQLRFFNVADFPDSGSAPVPVEVDVERAAATLRRHVPKEVPVLIDAGRRWALGYGLDTDAPNLLLFGRDGELAARFRGRRNDTLAREVYAAIAGLPELK